LEIAIPRMDTGAGLPPPSAATLESLRASREVQLWTVPLLADDSTWQDLTADEKQRAEKFRFIRDRDRFVAARAILRVLLGRYLSASPRELVLAYEPQGKPWIADTDLQFNLAHSADLALYAFCAGARIGVDIEHVRPMPDGEAVARRFFAAEEFAALQTLPLAEREPAFFACWTRKEAYVKAIGTGLSSRLDSFHVSFLPGAAPELVGGAGPWTLFDIQPGLGHRGAVAVEGNGWTLTPMHLEAKGVC
jgi:4'-phosphopantetheinyl transferase